MNKYSINIKKFNDAHGYDGDFDFGFGCGDGFGCEQGYVRVRVFFHQPSYEHEQS
jgi:hypothetical protein